MCDVVGVGCCAGIGDETDVRGGSCVCDEVDVGKLVVECESCSKSRKMMVGLDGKSDIVGVAGSGCGLKVEEREVNR